MTLNSPIIKTPCFYIFNSTKTSPNVGVSIPQLDKLQFSLKHRVPETLDDKGVNGFGKVSRKTDGRKNGVVRMPERRDFEGSLDEKTRGKVEKRKFGGRGNGNGVVEKLPTKCSTKWGSYGGCIPAMLRALDSISDVGEALRPWEESLSNKERSIILKEQSSWERALEVFEWFKSKGCYELNVIHYNIMFKILGKAKKWSYVESLWEEMSFRGIEPVNSTYGTLIDVYSKGGLKEKALVWLELMNKRGMEPDEVTMGIVLQMYKKAGEFQKADEFFKKWSLGESLSCAGMSGKKRDKEVNGLHSHVCLSSHTYNTLIDTYGKAGQLQEASQTFARMLKEGICPNTVTFNTMIHICGNHGHLGEVSLLMQKMEELRCFPDTRTYNILISLHAKHDDIDKALGYFQKMKETSLEPDVVSYRTLLYALSIRHLIREAEDIVLEMDERGLEIDEYTQSALTRMYIEAGMLEKSWTWFRRFHLAGNVTSECYSANIDAYGERGHTLEAEKVFNSCQEARKPSVLEFNVMIKAYGIGMHYDKACRLFDKMEACDVVPDKCSYNSLIQILTSADLPHKAKQYLRKMQEVGLASDCIPYCAVISSFVKIGQLDMAEEVYQEMIGFKVQPDVVLYGVLINAFADTGDVEKTLSYFDALKSAGLPGNAVIYNSLIKLYTKVGYLEEAEQIYEVLKSSPVGPDAYSSNCMIDLYSERSMVKRAKEVFESLKATGDANEFTFAMMLCMYKRIGMFCEAIQIAKEMRELGLIHDLLSYNNILGLYAIYGKFKEIVETFKEMVEAKVLPDDCTFRTLGIVLLKCGVSRKAVRKLEEKTKKDVWCSLQAWISVLSSVLIMRDGDF